MNLSRVLGQRQGLGAETEWACEHQDRYEMKLASEREAGLRLKGENGIMTRRFGALTLAVEEQRQAAADLEAQRAELQQVGCVCMLSVKACQPV